jgi:hypothetical protein
MPRDATARGSERVQRSWFVVTAVLVIGSCLSLRVLAQPREGAHEVSGAPTGYVEAINEALREFDNRNFEESRALFARAHAMFPNARTERGMGIAEFELRSYVESITHLRAALASEVWPLSDDLRADTEQMLERANHFVTQLQLDTRPRASSVLIDGQLVDATAPTLLLQVGEHLIEVRSEGYEPESRRVVIKSGGDIQVLTILFGRPDTRAEAPAPAPSKRWYKSPWLWAGVGVVTAGAVIAGALAATRDSPAGRVDGGSTNVSLRAP